MIGWTHAIEHSEPAGRTVASVDAGGVMAAVKVTLAGGEEVTASITRGWSSSPAPARCG